jgi:hypothetical protein
VQFAACGGSRGPNLVSHRLWILRTSSLLIYRYKCFSRRDPGKGGLVMQILTTNRYVLPACYLPDLALTTHPTWEDINPTTQIAALPYDSILLRTYSVARSM